MPSKLTLTLDAAQYQQQLEAVVQQTRQAAEQMAALSGDRKITVTAETSQAELVLSDLPQAEDQQISVAADTSQAEQALAELPQAKDQNIKIHADSDLSDTINDMSDAAADISNAAADMSDAASDMKSAASGASGGAPGGNNQLIHQIRSGAGAVSAIGAAAGQSVPAVGMLASVIGALTNPIGLITAAFTALVAVGTKVWDMLTVSVAEYAAKSKLASEEADREISKMKEQEAAAAGYISRLKELSSAEMTGKDAIRLTFDGPASVLEHSAKYGLQIASFFPAVCQLPHWSIAAEVMWKGHSRRLKLDESSGLVSHYSNFVAYQPEEIRMFSDYFRTAQTGWTLDDMPGWIPLGGQSLLFPDFMFRDASGREYPMELFHLWHAGQLEQRLCWCEERPNSNLLLGVDLLFLWKRKYLWPRVCRKNSFEHLQ